MKFTMADMADYFSSHPPGQGLLRYLAAIAVMSQDLKEQEINILGTLPCSQDSNIEDLRQVIIFFLQDENAKEILLQVLRGLQIAKRTRSAT